MPKRRIMVVDDEPAVLLISRQMLERLGYEVEAHSNGMDALEIFRREPGRIDLVITDMLMPGMTGNELADMVLQIRSEVPVILFSGCHGDEKSRKPGVRRILRKPVRIRELEDAVQRVLDEGPGRDLSSESISGKH